MPQLTTKKPTGKVYKRVLVDMQDYIVVEKDEGEGEGRLQCPRSDCLGEFVVNRAKWKEHASAGRVCPYCFRVSRVPGRRYAEESYGVAS